MTREVRPVVFSEAGQGGDEVSHGVLISTTGKIRLIKSYFLTFFRLKFIFGPFI